MGNRTKKILRRTGLGLLLLGSSAFALSAWDIYRFPKQAMNIPNADYAIILGATSEGNQPLPVFEARIRQGISLYQEAKVRKLIFTGGPGNPPQAEVGRGLALASGVPGDHILIETKSRTTLENLRGALELVPEPRSATFLIVSDPLHLKRALLMAGDLGMQAYPVPASATRILGGFSQIKFLARETFAMWKYRVLRLF